MVLHRVASCFLAGLSLFPDVSFIKTGDSFSPLFFKPVLCSVSWNRKCVCVCVSVRACVCVCVLHTAFYVYCDLLSLMSWQCLLNNRILFSTSMRFSLIRALILLLLRHAIHAQLNHPTKQFYTTAFLRARAPLHHCLKGVDGSLKKYTCNAYLFK